MVANDAVDFWKGVTTHKYLLRTVTRRVGETGGAF
jgi:hypothetical protein